MEIYYKWNAIRIAEVSLHKEFINTIVNVHMVVIAHNGHYFLK